MLRARQRRERSHCGGNCLVSGGSRRKRTARLGSGKSPRIMAPKSARGVPLPIRLLAQKKFGFWCALFFVCLLLCASFVFLKASLACLISVLPSCQCCEKVSAPYFAVRRQCRTLRPHPLIKRCHFSARPTFPPTPPEDPSVPLYGLIPTLICIPRLWFFFPL